MGFAVDTVASPGHTTSELSGIPTLFKQGINGWLQNSPGAAVLALTLEHHSEREWVELGNRLVANLLLLGSRYGVCLDGQCPVDVVLSWSRSITETHSLGLVQFNWMSSPHPVVASRHVENVTWCVIQDAAAKSWLMHLWQATGNELFHYGCDLIVAVYAVDKPVEIEWDQLMSIETFNETLPQAVSWLVPMDVGFIVGLQVESDLYRELQGYRTV